MLTSPARAFKTAQGSFSDISLIAPELGIAADNLSCGYYTAHTLHEYINRSQLNTVIQKVVDIVADSSRADFTGFDYRESLVPIADGYHSHLPLHNRIPLIEFSIGGISFCSSAKVF